MRARLIVAISALLLCGVAVADGVTWDQLSDEQRVVLGQFEGSFDELPADRRERLSRGAERFSTMTPEERAQAQARFMRWRELSDERRALIRERAEIFQNLPPEEQQRIRENYRRFQEMKRERREMLRDRYQRMTPEQRQRMRDRLKRRPASRRRD